LVVIGVCILTQPPITTGKITIKKVQSSGCWLALALGGRHFININNNQMEDGVDIRGCVGEEVRPGQNMWGGWLPVVWGGKLFYKKIERWEDPLP
jgi:hypothetical protein